MLPVIFQITLSVFWARVLAYIACAVAAAWSLRQAHVATGRWKDGLTSALTWGLGGAAVFHFVIKIDSFAEPVPLPLHTYGLLVAGAFTTAIYLAGREARRTGLDGEAVMDLSFWLLVCGMVGARIVFIMVNWDDYAHDWTQVLAFWKGGLVFYGGFLGAFAGAVYYMRKHGMPFLAYADVLAPSLSIGHAIGRLGCFSAGCCWGDVVHGALPWAAKFPPESLAYQSQLAEHKIAAGALTSLPVHPTQLYESLGEMAIFLILINLRKGKRFHGQILLSYLILYPLLRTVVEHFRGDDERGHLFGAQNHAWWNLSTSQFISVLVVSGGVALLVSLLRKSSPTPSASAA